MNWWLARRRGQYAWIIAHVPPGGIDTDAMPVSASAFSQIIQRFSPHVITGVFFGHTHRDEFQLVYAGDVTRHFEDDGPGRTPVNVAWIAQSITPLTNYNPGWRYYKVDSQTFQVMDSLNFTRASMIPLMQTVMNMARAPRTGMHCTLLAMSTHQMTGPQISL